VTFITVLLDRQEYPLSIKRTLEVMKMGKQKSGSEPNLKGTLLSVFGVGLVIVVMWFSVYGLYVSR